MKHFDVVIGAKQGFMSIFANEAGRASLKLRQRSMRMDWQNADDLPVQWQAVVWERVDMSGRDFAQQIADHLKPTKLRVGLILPGRFLEAIAPR
jgi:hypothetical protein